MARPAPAPEDVGRRLGERTIADFGEQWAADPTNEGFYGSLELFSDALGTLLRPEDFAGKRVADVGSGVGRIVCMLLAADAQHVTAVEPSAGVEALRRNVAEFGDRVRVIHAAGEALPPDLELDFVTAIGVIQFIPDPRPVLEAARAALRPGGRVVVWVYSAEGSRLYHLALRALRSVTPHLPHAALDALSGLLTVLLDVYTFACRWLPLPLRDYLLNVLSKCSFEKRKYTIYDQLNPSYVRFYTRGQLCELLEGCGFEDVRLYDRRGYSWTAVARRPAAGSPASS
jgi:SAM-dependent methyltransferase